MKRALVVSTPAILEARNLAAWITRERIPGVTIAPSKGEWGVFAPVRFAERARLAFRKVVAANNPGRYRIVFKLRYKDPYTSMRKSYPFSKATKLADGLVKGMALKAAVLDRRGKVRFVAFKRGKAASNPGMEGLADAAVTIALRGARAYLDRHGLKADPSALTATLRSWVKIKFPEALKDAKDAIAVGMHQVAEQTFAATMMQAGIEAAKEAARPPSASQNPRGLVPMEVKGTTQAARLLKYLRKQGIRAKLRHVTGRPGWFGFTCPLSQEEKSEQLCMKWSTLSEGLLDRPTHKALAAEKRWRMRQRRRRHRRGYRKGGYMIGGRTLPLDRPFPNARRARRNGSYYYTPKYRPPMTGTVPPGFTLVEAPTVGRWRSDIPISRYTFGVISYGRPLTDKEMRDYELDYATPRAGRNPRRTRRNPGPYVVEHKSDIMEVEWTRYGSYATEQEARAAMERLMFSGHDEGMPDDYLARTTCEGRVVATRRIKDWRGEKKRKPPHPINNPRRRPSRSGRSYTRRNPTMTTDEAWTALQWMAKNDPPRYQVMRRLAVNALNELLAGSGQGIGSSDVNHQIVAMIVSGDVTVTPGKPWKEREGPPDRSGPRRSFKGWWGEKNPPIDKAWDSMTSRKRLAALMIVGFPEDYATTMTGRPWSILSSSAKSALTRSWVAANRGRKRAVARR